MGTTNNSTGAKMQNVFHTKILTFQQLQQSSLTYGITSECHSISHGVGRFPQQICS